MTKVGQVMDEIERSGDMQPVVAAIAEWAEDRSIPDVAFRARVSDVLAFYFETVSTS